MKARFECEGHENQNHVGSGNKFSIKVICIILDLVLLPFLKPNRVSSRFHIRSRYLINSMSQIPAKDSRYLQSGKSKDLSDISHFFRGLIFYHSGAISGTISLFSESFYNRES